MELGGTKCALRWSKCVQRKAAGSIVENAATVKEDNSSTLAVKDVAIGLERAPCQAVMLKENFARVAGPRMAPSNGCCGIALTTQVDQEHLTKSSETM